MKNKIALLLTLTLVASTSLSQPFKSHAAEGKAIGVSFYKNIEFLGFTFFLGSMGAAFENDHELLSNGVTKQEWHAYNFSLYHQYKQHLHNPNLVNIAMTAERMEGSDLLRLLLQLDDFPNANTSGLAAEYYRPFSSSVNSEEGLRVVTEFIAALNAFYSEVNFDEYFSRQNKLYDHAIKEIVSALPENKFIPAMEKFYQRGFYSYTLIPSLTIPSGMAFGTNYTEHGRTHIFNAFGPFDLQRFTDLNNINLGFANKEHLRELSTHEFGHSFSNPVVDEIPEAMVKDTKELFAPVSGAMDNQGYPTWESCLYEHFVRATEVVIARNLGKKKEADALLKSYVEGRKFIYLPQIIASLEKYNEDRKKSTYNAAVMEAMNTLVLLAKK
jgi:hypothetical protein